MKKYIKGIAIVLIIVILAIILIIVNNKKEKHSENERFKIVTSFYPIYIMVTNITDGAQNIELVNMTETNAGCVHNYTLSTVDMKKIEHANVFIQNGLGLEDFSDKIVTSNKNLQIINASETLTNIIHEEDETNAHVWTSITNYIEQIKCITGKLSEINPENVELYETNSKKYIQELMQIKQKYDTELKNLKGKSAVSLNESFEYLGRDLGLTLTTIHTSHEESAISAENLKSVIEEMKQNETKIIIVDIDDNLKNAQTIANETGAKIYKLNSGVTGTVSKEAYINMMNSNLEQLKTN